MGRKKHRGDIAFKKKRSLERFYAGGGGKKSYSGLLQKVLCFKELGGEGGKNSERKNLRGIRAGRRQGT